MFGQAQIVRERVCVTNDQAHLCVDFPADTVSILLCLVYVLSQFWIFYRDQKEINVVGDDEW